MEYEAIIVGGGMAGLTAAAYLARAGKSVLLCEKGSKVGGLVNTFDYHGFSFDGGIRAFENSGIVVPMLRQLGVEIDWVRSTVSIGVDDDVVAIESKESLEAYQRQLDRLFPESKQDIGRIIGEIRRVMKYMDVLYGIDNPLFLDNMLDPSYLLRTLLPWMLKYQRTIRKINRLSAPINEYLAGFTRNQALIDIITQHFFKKTPAFFALSYFSLYLDYRYPVGGTGVLARRMEQFIVEHRGEIRVDTEIAKCRPERHEVEDTRGNVYPYRKLIWAADSKKLYSLCDPNELENRQVREAVKIQKDLVSRSSGGDSIFTLFVTLDMDRHSLANTTTAHLFYTPRKVGLGSLVADLARASVLEHGRTTYKLDKEEILQWLRQYLDRTTYEISIPSLRDENLSPPGKTGVIISTLMDYPLAKQIQDAGWYDEFKAFCSSCILDILDQTLFAGFKDHVTDQFASTPVTLETMTGNADGAITGWAFTNEVMPAVHRMSQVSRSVRTPFPDILQAGQWVFSPSGLPISILTGKLAADRVLRDRSSKSSG